MLRKPLPLPARSSPRSHTHRHRETTHTSDTWQRRTALRRRLHEASSGGIACSRPASLARPCTLYSGDSRGRCGLVRRPRPSGSSASRTDLHTSAFARSGVGNRARPTDRPTQQPTDRPTDPSALCARYSDSQRLVASLTSVRPPLVCAQSVDRWLSRRRVAGRSLAMSKSRHVGTCLDHAVSLPR